MRKFTYTYSTAVLRLVFCILAVLNTYVVAVATLFYLFWYVGVGVGVGVGTIT
jgi:hypothetical protein